MNDKFFFFYRTPIRKILAITWLCDKITLTLTTNHKSIFKKKKLQDI